MKIQDQIDSTLRLIGSAVPPSDLEARIEARLRASTRRGGLAAVHYLSIAAIAASVAIATVALNPTVRSLATQDFPLNGHWGSSAPRVVHSGGAFGAASAVHVPATPMPVLPTPVTQGRGHTRSRRTLLPEESRTPLPHGVAIPAEAHMPPAPAPAPSAKLSRPQ